MTSVQVMEVAGTDLTVVNAARVSFNKESSWETIPEAGPVRDLLKETDEKLITYLAKHKHWTPFAHTSLQFRIKAPLFVARQLGKHQVGLVWNEISRRYVDYEPEFYYPEYWRGRPENKKQGSSDKVIDINPATGSGPSLLDNYEQAIRRCMWAYDDLLRKGVAPEMARMVLPQSMLTEWYWTGSLVSFARICSLRSKTDAQKETQEISSMLEIQCAEHFPSSWQALMTP